MEQPLCLCHYVVGHVLHSRLKGTQEAVLSEAHRQDTYAYTPGQRQDRKRSCEFRCYPIRAGCSADQQLLS
jgi:hypothetical protein